ncbi:MAG: hypothetical protein H0V36_04525 [Chloroflexi bacterium]|nr:hypothetical protein [Chloroflexota bacterium]
MDEDMREQRKEALPDPEDTEQGSDTEGHSLLQAELHRQIATSRTREASDWARGEAARRKVKDRAKRG